MESRVRRRLAAWAALAATALAPLAAAPAKAEDDGVWDTMRGYVEREMEARDVPGVAVSLVSEEGVLHSEGFGVADIDGGEKVDPETTRFSLASEAKLFTAQAVLQLVEDGAVDLDADVNEYLEGFRIEDAYPGRPVTVRNLLTYTGGFDEDHFIGMGVESGPVTPLGEELEEKQPERVRPPGKLVSYDNYGFALAAYIVECVTDMPFAKYLEDNVFEPLGMGASSAAVPYDEETERDVATGYIIGRDGKRPTEMRYGALFPVGIGPVASGDDMAVYLAAMMARDPRLGDGVAERMLSPQFRNAPEFSAMGFGWEQTSVAGRSVWFKAGDLPGFHTGMAIIPDLGIGFHIASNADSDEGGGIGPVDLLEEVIAEHLPALEAPEEEAVTADSEQYEGTFISSRTSRNGFIRFRPLVDGPVTVATGEEGSLVTEGLFGKKVTWTPVGEGRYVREGTFHRLTFIDRDTFALDGHVIGYERVEWFQNPTLYRVLLAAALASVLLVLVGVPIAAWHRRAAPRWIVPWVNAALVTAFIAIGAVLAESKGAFTVALLTADPLLVAALILAALTLPVTVVQVVFAVRALAKRQGSVMGRVSYAAATLGAVAFTLACAEYNILSLPFL
ncbi:serine hydrolase domain-containing protein [Salininema proteolyticum]|uniref:Serine hydrolase domain-containing protein n=1 Tax=Salininema proteolyticum TaxID=1607685 RepID=A0ABV8U1Y1_9ACTN